MRRVQRRLHVAQTLRHVVEVHLEAEDAGRAGGAVIHLNLDGIAARRPPEAGVEHMGRDHTPSRNFAIRSRRIFACSSAAVRISCARSLPSRACTVASISPALRPVAQSRKTKPNFAKYSSL